MENRVCASYQLPGDATYEYEVSWFPSGEGVFWHAIIACDNQIKGKPWGAVNGYQGRDIRAAVIDAVQQSIKNLHTVRSVARTDFAIAGAAGR